MTFEEKKLLKRGLRILSSLDERLGRIEVLMTPEPESEPMYCLVWTTPDGSEYHSNRQDTYDFMNDHWDWVVNDPDWISSFNMLFGCDLLSMYTADDDDDLYDWYVADRVTIVRADDES